MVTIDYSSHEFISDKYLFVGDYFYKLVTESSKKVIDTIIANKDKISIANYSIPDEYCLTKDGKVCYRTKILKDYKTIDTIIELGMYLDPERIATSLAKVYVELKSIGVCYYDFHSGNILIDKHDNIVLVDLDDASLAKNPDSYVYSTYLLFEFIFQIITYGERFIDYGHSITLSLINEKYHIFDVFDRKTRKILNKICDYRVKTNKLNYEDLVKKLCKMDNVDKIKKRIYS